MGRLFSRLLVDKNLTHDTTGRKIHMNSFCRHTALKHELIRAESSVADVALRAGNTLQTISSNYLEMYVEDRAKQLASQHPKGKGVRWGVWDSQMKRVQKYSAPHTHPAYEMLDDEKRMNELLETPAVELDPVIELPAADLPEDLPVDTSQPAHQEHTNWLEVMGWD
jgi:hypothetical protein